MLIFLINSDRQTGHLGFIKKMTPLAFDPELEVDYLQCLGSDEKKLRVFGELESLYSEIENKSERFEALDAIGNPNVWFHSDDELGDEDDLENTE